MSIGSPPASQYLALPSPGRQQRLSLLARQAPCDLHSSCTSINWRPKEATTKKWNPSLGVAVSLDSFSSSISNTIQARPPALPSFSKPKFQHAQVPSKLSSASTLHPSSTGFHPLALTSRPVVLTLILQHWIGSSITHSYSLPLTLMLSAHIFQDPI